MDNFVFQNTTKIIFGKGSENEVAKEIKKYGKKVLLHYGGGSIKSSGLYDKVVASLKEENIEYIELAGVKANPRLSLVRDGIKLCRENDIDFILAVGGGSVIDSAKTIAIGVPYEGDVWDFFTGRNYATKTLPVGTILTISAAGSEASNSCVITNEDGDYKRGTGSEVMRPVFSILNPELLFTLPNYQISCGAADIMAHLMERYFTNTKAVELIDRLIESTMKTIINNAPKVIKDKEDYDSWSEFMWAGTVAHNDVLSTGRVGDWASHGIEHEISGIYDVAHGAGLAVVFPAWMKYVYKHDINRFVQFAVRVWNVDMNVWNPEETALEGIKKLETFFKHIGLPVTLKELSISDDRIEEMAEKATGNGSYSIGNFVKLTKEDIIKILRLAE